MEIQSLLRAQIQAAEDLPYRLPGARRPSLATVYVRQELGSGTEETRSDQPPEHTPKLDEREQLMDVPRAPVSRSKVRPPSRAVREALDGEPHLLVTGGPGQGKSTLSLRLAAEAAAGWSSPHEGGTPLSEPVVPLRLTARELAARLDMSFPQALAEGVRAEYGALLRVPVDERLLSARVAGCRWLLLVDALDEVADGEERDRLVTVLAALASDPADSHRVIVTTRPIEGAALAPLQRIGCSRYELQPFDEEALRRFAENWFAEESSDHAHRFVEQVREAHLDELVQVPLLATIAAIIFQEHRDRPLPDNQYELYEAYLGFLRHGRPTGPGPFEEHRVGLLEHLGRTRLESDTSLSAAAQDWVQAHRTPGKLPPTWREDLTAFLTSVGPLVVHGRDLKFLHHSFAEHLAATAKARKLTEHFAPESDEFAELLHAALPEVSGRHARAVLLHYTRLRPTEADEVVQSLHAANFDQHLLAARLLARHVPASEHVVDAFLQTVRVWAMAPQDRAHDILEQASRAAHHPGLLGWLDDLMRDRRAPWRSRVEAATALAVRLRSDCDGDAIAMLRAAVDGSDASVEHRLVAAEALAQSSSHEQETAERGLRSVLHDPATDGASRRTAAVVLAALGERGRRDAVAALSGLISDDTTSTRDLVEAAMGLLEIDVEFHPRSAEIFRDVLQSPVRDFIGRRDAALGLSSLGTRHASEAADCLTGLATDRSHRFADRILAADALAALGPQHRVAAGELLSAMSAEPGLTDHSRWTCADSMSECGPHFREQAISQLRSIIADQRIADTRIKRFAAESLAELGPEFRTEAAHELERQTNDPRTSRSDYVRALGELAELGEPYRGPAVRLLRGAMTDYGVEPMERCVAAAELVRVVPDFHDEAATVLLALARDQFDRRVVFRAWQELLSLRTAFLAEGVAVLIGLIRSKDSGIEIQAVVTVASYVGHHAEFAQALETVLGDQTRSAMVRCSAARGLVRLGSRFHGSAVAGLRELLASDLPMELDLCYSVSPFTSVGIGLRAELAEALRTLVTESGASSDRMWHAVSAMNQLGHANGPEVERAVRAVIADEATGPDVRAKAAVFLARLYPEEHRELTRKVLEIGERLLPYQLSDAVFDLADLGAEVTTLLQSLLADGSAARSVRRTVASTLHQLHADAAPAALTELHSQAEDMHLGLSWRIDAITQLTELDPPSRSGELPLLRSLLDDKNSRLPDRCHAACVLASRHPEHAMTALAALRRFSTDSQLLPRERAVAVMWLDVLLPDQTDEMVRLALGSLHHPGFKARWYSILLDVLGRRMRQGIEHFLLLDHSVPLGDRMPDTNGWADLQVWQAAESAAREELTAPESLPSERVAAAAALATMSPRLRREARTVLARLAEQGHAPFAARRALADIDREQRERVRAQARDLHRDQAVPRHTRLRALRLLLDITDAATGTTAQSLREALADERMSDNAKMSILFALRHEDQLDQLRRLRDDECTSPPARWRAAKLLAAYTVEDRAIAAATLNSLATDTSLHAALRWRVADDLADLGDRGRSLAISALLSITDDETLPIIARADAARTLIVNAPGRRRTAMATLENLRSAENPLQRIQVLRAIGLLAPDDAIHELRAVANDDTLRPAARLRCAENLLDVRHDQRELAAATARTVALNAAAPRHVRIRAARALARWSEACKEEARELLRTLR
ncbi:hypothetical protein GCM10020366_36560 [Saccharopolyspora gregorii]|uniref:NACHT domain-containing protein n=1 Tax=Saccharopolyspora gregorii TaxID=33914 RepID=A0ABP6RV48_9PSEU